MYWLLFARQLIRQSIICESADALKVNHFDMTRKLKVYLLEAEVGAESCLCKELRFRSRSSWSGGKMKSVREPVLLWPPDLGGMTSESLPGPPKVMCPWEKTLRCCRCWFCTAATFVFAVEVEAAAEVAAEVVDKLTVLVTAALAGLLTLLCSCPPRKLRTLPPALALRTWPRRTGGRIADGNRWNPAV